MENTFHIFKNSVTVHVNGQTVTISKDDVRYPKIMEVIEANRINEIGNVLKTEECISRIQKLLDLE